MKRTDEVDGFKSYWENLNWESFDPETYKLDLEIAIGHRKELIAEKEKIKKFIHFVQRLLISVLVIMGAYLSRIPNLIAFEVGEGLVSKADLDGTSQFVVIGFIAIFFVLIYSLLLSAKDVENLNHKKFNSDNFHIQEISPFLSRLGNEPSNNAPRKLLFEAAKIAEYKNAVLRKENRILDKKIYTLYEGLVGLSAIIFLFVIAILIFKG